MHQVHQQLGSYKLEQVFLPNDTGIVIKLNYPDLNKLDIPNTKYTRNVISSRFKNIRAKHYNEAILTNLEILLSSSKSFLAIINERSNGGVLIGSEKDFISYRSDFEINNPGFVLEGIDEFNFCIQHQSFIKFAFSIMQSRSGKLVSENFRNIKLKF